MNLVDMMMGKYKKKSTFLKYSLLVLIILFLNFLRERVLVGNVQGESFIQKLGRFFKVNWDALVGALSSENYFYIYSQIFFLLASLIIIFLQRKQFLELLKSWGRTYTELPIPKTPKLCITLVVFIQLFHCFIAKMKYPFHDINMFKFSRSGAAKNPVVKRYKYYFQKSDGQIKVVNLRKQHVLFFNDLLPYQFNNEYTFAATFYWQKYKKNFEFLSNSLRESSNIKNLSLGMQVVNFQTGEVTFYKNNEIKRDGSAPLYDPELKL